MRTVMRDFWDRTKRQVRADLEKDPYLLYILSLALILAGFWFWHSVPNFATRDERWRILEPIEPIGFFVDDPNFGAIREGIELWRQYGATFYLYGFFVIPLFVYVVLTGQPEILSAVGHHSHSALWAHWNRGPAWLWTGGVLFARLINIFLAVGCVYVTYRFATLMRDRATGRLAAIFLALTWGLVVLAHEGGEDVPALFFFILVIYLGLRYIQSGERRIFYAACVCGGIAAAMKLTVLVAVPLIVAAHLLREWRTEGRLLTSSFQPGFLFRGAFLGAVVITVGYPVVLVSGPSYLGARILRGATEKAVEGHYLLVKPTWWWLLRGYLHGLGVPLFAGAVVGIVASLPRLRERSLETDGILLALAGVGAFVIVYSFWEYVRMHHLLPTFPLLVVLMAVALRRFSDRRSTIVRIFVAFLIVTTALYTVGGDLAYASQPRDEARAWISNHADNETSIETYVRDPQDAAVPHGMEVYRVTERNMTINGTVRELSVIKWMQAMPQRCPTYIQLNYRRGLMFLASGDYIHQGERISNPMGERYVKRLFSEEHYPYEIAAQFGRTPAFIRNTSQKDGLIRPTGNRDPGLSLLQVGIYPRTAQYGDPQDFGVSQYTVIFERTGACNSTV